MKEKGEKTGKKALTGGEWCGIICERQTERKKSWQTLNGCGKIEKFRQSRKIRVRKIAGAIRKNENGRQKNLEKSSWQTSKDVIK